jgi:conjugal transfer pilus assembly protein TraD
MPKPVLAYVLTGVAGSLTVGVVTVPLVPWLAPDLQPLALTLSAAWTAWRLLVLDRACARQRAWTHNRAWQIAPEALATMTTPAWRWGGSRRAHAGVCLGSAFRWNGTHTQQLETALAQDGALPIAADDRGGHPCLHAVGQRREQPLHIPWRELEGHTLLTGTTGSGKTRLLEVLATEVIRGPGAVVILDPKGDRELLVRCAAEAHRQQRPFAVVTPASPQHSARLNVLATATTPAEVSARIRALMPSAGGRTTDPFFEEYPLALIERLAAAQATLGHPWSLEGLYPPAVLRSHFEQLLAAYLTHRGYSGPRGLPQLIKHYQATGPTDLLADALIDDLDKPREHFTKVTSNLIPAFRGVVGAPLGPLFSTIPGDLTWDRIADAPMVVYVALASLLLGDIAHRIGRVLLQDLVGFLGRRYAYTDVRTATPLTLLIDEFAQVAYPLFPNALAMSRGAGARFILAQQSLADAEAAIGAAQARRVADNLNTKLWLRVADDRTAADATEGLGLCTVRLLDTGVGLSFGGMGGLSGSTQRRLVARETPLIRPTWLTALPQGEAIVRMKGEVWKLRVPLLTPVPPATIEALGLTALWQALDPHTKEGICPDTSSCAVSVS